MVKNIKVSRLKYTSFFNVFLVLQTLKVRASNGCFSFTMLFYKYEYIGAESFHNVVMHLFYFFSIFSELS